jgi:hypothetical protein
MATFQRDSNGNWIALKPKSQPRLVMITVVTLLIVAIPLLALAYPHLTPLKQLPQSRPSLPKAKNAAPKKSQSNPYNPTYGQIKLGAFAAEAAHLAGLKFISTNGLADPAAYAKYRSSIRNTYGKDLEDMNYFSLAPTNFEDRVIQLQKWMINASKYGDVTLAIEPLGPEKYQFFDQPDKLLKLSQTFRHPQLKNTTIWIRFASESNLRGSEYSAIKQPEVFRQAAINLKHYLPKNAKLVFSPLINTYVAGRLAQRDFAQSVLAPHNNQPLWDCIGGTIYRTNLPLKPTYDQYYQEMVEISPNTPFQICELGGPYSKRKEVLKFLSDCAKGDYPQLIKVNLFARDINKRADPLAEFGFLEPAERATKSDFAQSSQTPAKMESFLKPILRQPVAEQ